MDLDQLPMRLPATCAVGATLALVACGPKDVGLGGPSACDGDGEAPVTAWVGSDVPFWDPYTAECAGEPAPESPWDGVTVRHIGIAPVADDVPCAAHAECEPDGFCGAGFCRPIAEAAVTVCVTQVALVGPADRLRTPASAPDIHLVLGPHGAEFFWYWTPYRATDACRVAMENCVLMPLALLAESTLVVRDDDRDARSGPDSVSMFEGTAHYLGPIDEILSHLGAVYEVPEGMSGYDVKPATFQSRVWVSLAYP